MYIVANKWLALLLHNLLLPTLIQHSETWMLVCPKVWICFLKENKINRIYKVIIHLKKLLSSDWLKRSAFLVNTVQKSETRVQITTKISEVKTKTAGGQPIYFKVHRRSCETFRRFPKITWTLPKITEDHMKPSKDFRRSPENFRRFPKISQIFPKFSEDTRTILKTCDNLRRSPDIFKAFPSFGRLRAIPSAYLSSKHMVRGFKLSIFFKCIINMKVITWFFSCNLE